MKKFTVIAIGDSVVWGQGLKEHQKFHKLAVERIAGEMGIVQRDIQIVHLAHSGAVIDAPDLPPPVDSGLRFWQEVPHSTPTIMEQLDSVAVSSKVDLVLISGGINDINFRTIVNPLSLSETDLETSIRKNCYVKIKRLLERTRRRFPGAVIIVVGYFPILSEFSDETVLRLTASLFLAFAGVFTLLSVPIARRAAYRSHYFHRSQLSWLRRAVTELSSDPAMRGPGIYLAHPVFGPRNSVGAPEALLFEPKTPEDPDDLRELWLSFVHNVLPGVAVVHPNDAMFSHRHRTCKRLYSNPSAELLQCALASIGHPNVQGARRYAEAITDTYLTNRQISLRPHLSKLLKHSSHLSLRRAVQRYGLTMLPASLRNFMQHMMVDSIDVTIKTSDELFAGTDDDIYLRVSRSREWRLNYAMNEGDLVNDFEAGSTGNYTVDPAEGRPDSRLHLGEIEEISLVKKPAPGSIASDWRPAWIRVALNGHQVLQIRIDRELTRSEPVWTAPNYPRRM